MRSGGTIGLKFDKTELRSSQSDSKYGPEGLQENVWYVLCHINLVNAVISVIDVGSSNEVWRYHRSEVWPSHSDVGGSNEIWRYHRSELRPLHSASKYSCEGSKRISDMFLCHIHLLNAAISVIVALGYSPNQRCLKYDRYRVTLMSVYVVQCGPKLVMYRSLIGLERSVDTSWNLVTEKVFTTEKNGKCRAMISPEEAEAPSFINLIDFFNHIHIMVTLGHSCVLNSPWYPRLYGPVTSNRSEN
jgi:hypothetical protein